LNAPGARSYIPWRHSDFFVGAPASSGVRLRPPMQDIVAFGLVSFLVLYVGIVAQQKIGGRLGQLILVGCFLRIVGATLRLGVIEFAYGGGSDAKAYFAFGKEYAERMAHLDFHFFLGDENSQDPQW